MYETSHLIKIEFFTELIDQTELAPVNWRSIAILVEMANEANENTMLEYITVG